MDTRWKSPAFKAKPKVPLLIRADYELLPNQKYFVGYVKHRSDGPLFVIPMIDAGKRQIIKWRYIEA